METNNKLCYFGLANVQIVGNSSGGVGCGCSSCLKEYLIFSLSIFCTYIVIILFDLMNLQHLPLKCLLLLGHIRESCY